MESRQHLPGPEPSPVITEPVTQPEYLGNPGIGPIEVEPSAPALLGLRRFVRAARHAWAEETVNTISHPDVRKEVAAAVLEGRLPKPGLEPVTFVERRSSIRASRKKNRAIRHATRQIRLGTYGHEDASGRPFFIDTSEKGADGELIDTRELGRPDYDVVYDEKTKKNKVVVRPTPLSSNRLGGDYSPFEGQDGNRNRNPRASDIGTPVQLKRLEEKRYPKFRVEDEKKQGYKFIRARMRKNKEVAKVMRTEEGKDILTPVIKRRYERATERVEKHHQHLENLRRLQPIADRQKEQKRQAKEARKISRKQERDQKHMARRQRAQKPTSPELVVKQEAQEPPHWRTPLE